MKISILIPCYNEELTIEKCVLSCLNQTRVPDEIVVINDSSTDNTAKVLEKFSAPVKVYKTPKNTGNKSYAQEYGIQFITGDVFIATDGDTTLDEKFVEFIEEDMKNTEISAIAGYVKSYKYNWITSCRGLDYTISQNIDKLAQDYLNFIFVIPGAAGAFRTDVFKNKIQFTHDTITEDLDFTYRLHETKHIIRYDRRAICYTQDPVTLKAYINQMRRWFGGGWQNFVKHIGVPSKPGMALEISLIYIEGLIYSFMMFLMPLINLYLTFYVLMIYVFIVCCLALYAALKEKRIDFLLVVPGYILMKYVNAYIFLEQFFYEVVLRRKNLYWFKPERIKFKK